MHHVRWSRQARYALLRFSCPYESLLLLLKKLSISELDHDNVKPLHLLLTGSQSLVFEVH